jgi:hypothetical protein
MNGQLARGLISVEPDHVQPAGNAWMTNLIQASSILHQRLMLGEP